MHEFHTRRKVEFVDTDMEGIVHFSRFMIYMETAEHEFLEALGSRVATMVDGLRIGWPRVAVACEYEKPARFGDVLDIRLAVLRKGRRSMTYGFTFTRDGERLATGKVTAVCCELGPAGMRPIEIPGSISSRVEQVPGPEGAG